MSVSDSALIHLTKQIQKLRAQVAAGGKLRDYVVGLRYLHPSDLQRLTFAIAEYDASKGIAAIDDKISKSETTL